MKKSTVKTALSFSALILILFFSCGEKEDPEISKEEMEGTVLKMDLNGSPWSAKWGYTLTSPSEDEGEDYFLVFITGSNIDFEEDEDEIDNESLSFYIAVHNSKFKNPVGTYPIAGLDYLNESSPAAAIFNKMTDDEAISYISATKNGEERQVGTISIESFKIGQQKFMGQDMGEGYTELSGSFTINEMVGFKNESEKPLESTLKLTNGKFALKNGLDFNFFGMNAGK